MKYIIDRDRLIECIKNLGNSMGSERSVDYIDGYSEALDDVLKIILSFNI